MATLISSTINGTLRTTEQVGINIAPRTDAYRLSISGSIHLNYNSVDYVGSLYLEGSGTGAHLQPNGGSYGSLQVSGSKNSWHGIRFTGSDVNLMANANEVGFHNNAAGWQFLWSAGTAYVYKGGTGAGTQATVLDSSNAAYAWNMDQYVRTTDGVSFQDITANGALKVVGAFRDSNGSAGTSGQVLSSTVTGTAWIAPPSGGGTLSGSGTTNYVSKWTGSTSLGNSIIFDNGTNVGINTTNPGYRLDVTGDIRATGDIIAYSDARVKENVETISDALDKVKAMRGVNYNKIGEIKRSVGVIAQELLEVVPEAVQQDYRGMYSVAYGNLVGVLIEAIKEQQSQIEELKAEIQKLKSN